MNLRFSKRISTARRIFAAVALLVLFSRASSFAAPEERWLLVFDTSSAMRNRLPAVETEIKSLFASSISQNLHAGDSVGVWTFDKQLRTGEFPLTMWAPENAAQTTSSLIAFLRRQRYSGETSFNALQPLLGQVIAGSERLTVVIVCDGGDDVHWTPYDQGINETLNQTRAERKKSRQPYVILIRTQLGKYISATVNFPPAVLDVPPFPSLFEETKAVPANPPPTPVVPVETKPVAVSSLVIVGTNVGTDLVEMQKSFPVTNPSVATAPPKPSLPPVETKPTNIIIISQSPPTVPAMKIVPAAKTNVVTVAAVVPTTAQTNAPIASAPVSPRATDNDARILIYIGGGMFAAAATLVILLLVRSRRVPRGSLISRSMQEDSRPPDRK